MGDYSVAFPLHPHKDWSTKVFIMAMQHKLASKESLSTWPQLASFIDLNTAALCECFYYLNVISNSKEHCNSYTVRNFIFECKHSFSYSQLGWGKH